MPPPHPKGWTRVVLEKPFGSDYDSALDLVQRLSEFLREEEIYRIDHYLGSTPPPDFSATCRCSDPAPTLVPLGATVNAGRIPTI